MCKTKGITDGSRVCTCTYFSFLVASNATKKVSIAGIWIRFESIPLSLVAVCFYQYFPPDCDAEGTNGAAMSVVNNCYTV